LTVVSGRKYAYAFSRHPPSQSFPSQSFCGAICRSSRSKARLRSRSTIHSWLRLRHGGNTSASPQAIRSRPFLSNACSTIHICRPSPSRYIAVPCLPANRRLTSTKYFPRSHVADCHVDRCAHLSDGQVITTLEPAFQFQSQVGLRAEFKTHHIQRSPITTIRLCIHFRQQR